ncbi:hypothetical protein B0T10DRAFT_172288 [Thelonectria olida]|uniref:Secreted protein n=1 Tax=Thelonectria olida TaxID=1576542 RepID=A0A9P8WED9_9HYPO|nr:hypothetical protein B0T10DRAFT_172288 [Thelonectria olida]
MTRSFRHIFSFSMSCFFFSFWCCALGLQNGRRLGSLKVSPIAFDSHDEGSSGQEMRERETQWQREEIAAILEYSTGVWKLEAFVFLVGRLGIREVTETHENKTHLHLINSSLLL